MNQYKTELIYLLFANPNPFYHLMTLPISYIVENIYSGVRWGVGEDRIV